jgi:hypothetical protein
MSIIEDYNTKLEVIKAIPDDQIKTPHAMPVGVYIQEAGDLFIWCQDDKDALTAKNLDWTVVEDLPVRCCALFAAEAKWGNEWRTREEAEKLWMLESPKGYDLRNEIAHHFYYAFNDDPTLISKINRFLEGTTHAEMIQSLVSLSEMGQSNQELLTSIGFDLTLLDLAAQKAAELHTLYATATRDRQDFSEFKKIRDQAYTHVKEAVDLIRKCGKYVFWRNESRLKGYRSDFLRRVSRRSTEDNIEPVPGPLPEPDELELETETTPA